MLTHKLPLISILIIQSFISGIWILLSNENRAKNIAISASVFSLLLGSLLYLGFDTTTANMQFVEDYNWIASLRINYYVGIDGISLPLILLTLFINLIIVITAEDLVKQQLNYYLSLFFFLQAMVIGVFVALNAFLYYLFWEGMLIPMYLCIGIWGSQLRSYAAIKFFIYTFFGSVIMLLALIYLSIKAGSSSILSFYNLPLTLYEQSLILLALMLAFAVKIPMWPVHTWLPDAHTEAPAGGSVILAALMLKVGAYGFFRFCLPITPDACLEASWLMIVLSLIAIVNIGLVALAQHDMKRLIAYSSVAHMGFVSLGCFMIYPIFKNSGHLPSAQLALSGALVQMITHAFGSGGMFLAFGLLYDKLHSRLIADMGGIVQKMPYFTAFFLIFALSNVGLPGTAGFVGEFMVLVSAVQSNFWVALLAGLTLVLSASYTLFMFKRVFYGPITQSNVENLVDISSQQYIALSLMVLGIFFIGLYPQPLINIMDKSIVNLVQLALQVKF